MPIGTNIQTAANILREGGIVAIPTETVYGLAANAYTEAAVLKIFQAKQRPAFDPLIVHVHSLEQVKAVVTFSDLERMGMRKEAEALMEKFWPGPLTLAPLIGLPTRRAQCEPLRLREPNHRTTRGGPAWR